jgi:hypothetical protein
MARRYRKAVRERWHDALSRVSWDTFEQVLAAYYRAQGYRVDHSGTGGAAGLTDGGIDLKLYRDDAYIVVQCKHWNVVQVPHNAVHELLGVMHTQGATGAILISSGEFTPAARAAAARAPAIQLIDGAEVRRMLGDAIPMPTARPGSHAPTWAQPRASASPSWVAAAVFAVMVSVGFGGYLWTRVIQAQRQWPVQGAAVVARPQPGGDATRRAARQGAPSTFHPHTVAVMAAQHTVASPLPPPIVRADGTPAKLGTTPTSSAELREWERQNAEAMRILEKTTPSLD